MERTLLGGVVPGKRVKDLAGIELDTVNHRSSLLNRHGQLGTPVFTGIYCGRREIPVTIIRYEERLTKYVR